MKSPDPVKRGLALQTLLCLARSAECPPEPGRIIALLYPLLDDPSEIRTFQDGSFVRCKIDHMAGELLRVLHQSLP